MRRLRLGLIIIVLGSISFAGANLSQSATAEKADCLIAPVADCGVGNGGGNVNVGGTVEEHHDPPPPPPPPPPEGNGGDFGGNPDDGTGDADNGNGGGNGSADDDPRCDPDESSEEECDPWGRVIGGDDPEPPAVVTSTQLLSFRPPAPSLASEPDGVAIVGMPMNVVVPASANTSDGTLLGFEVRVRFTPERLAIDYGDGASAQAPPDSATWASLGQAEFTSTETSHAYEQRGTYTVSARVLYSAAVEFVGYGTIPVDGLVSSAAATTSVRAVTADTGLVDKTCAEDPGGPGC